MAGMWTEFTVTPRRRWEGDRDAGPRIAAGSLRREEH